MENKINELKKQIKFIEKDSGLYEFEKNLLISKIKKELKELSKNTK